MENEELLCEAARNGDADKAKALISAGADVTYFDGEGLTPLMHAAKLGHAEILKILLEAGAPWNALSPSNVSAGDLAMDSVHQESFDLLLNAGTQLHFQCKLHYFEVNENYNAVMFDYFEILMFFYENDNNCD